MGMMYQCMVSDGCRSISNADWVYSEYIDVNSSHNSNLERMGCCQLHHNLFSDGCKASNVYDKKAAELVLSGFVVVLVRPHRGLLLLLPGYLKYLKFWKVAFHREVVLLQPPQAFVFLFLCEFRFAFLLRLCTWRGSPPLHLCNS